MERLLLTSAGMNVREEILKILPKSPKETKIAHITTASKAEEDTGYVQKDTDLMRQVGFQVEQVDLDNLKEGDLRNILQDKDVIYVQGGNTFYLLSAIRKSGFEKVVRDLIGKGVIYIGVSAGSYIACPTIEMATWKHQDRDTIGLKDLSAMNLVPFLLSVHYKPEYKDILKEAIETTKYPVKILTDDQAILVRDGKCQLVGKGPEILL